MQTPFQGIALMIIKGRKGVSAETALDLEKAFPEIPADFWLQLEMRLSIEHRTFTTART